MDKSIFTGDENQVFDLVESSPDGISTDEARRRLERYGRNVIEEKRATPLWRKLLSNFTHFSAILLWIAGILAFVGSTPGRISGGSTVKIRRRLPRRPHRFRCAG